MLCPSRKDDYNRSCCAVLFSSPRRCVARISTQSGTTGDAWNLKVCERLSATARNLYGGRRIPVKMPNVAGLVERRSARCWPTILPIDIKAAFGARTKPSP